jgi:hypothetical protein
MFKFISSITVAAGMVALSGLAASSAQAASLDFTGWTPAGDVTKSLSSATITNADNDGLDDSSNINLSGTDPLGPGDLEDSLGLSTGGLGSSAQEGSGIYTDLTVGAGDLFSFDWSIDNLDSADRISAAINGNIFDLVGLVGSSYSFSHSFATAGTFRVGVGVVDQDNSVNSSKLTISNAQLTPAAAIPTPAMLPGMIGFGLSLIRKRRPQPSTGSCPP